jgi:hypothetical protein
LGLESGRTTNYIIDKLDFNTILKLLQHRQLQRAGEEGVPIVDVDVTWVVRRNTKMSFDMRFVSLIRLALLFIQNGCRVN